MAASGATAISLLGTRWNSSGVTRSEEEALRKKLAADPQRPQYHFLPPAHWLNDPNGPLFWKGKYHMFYQHNPNGAFWGTMHWGHAVSEDLVRWKHLPIALAPTPGGPDKDGCFSGCAVINDGVPTLVYTGVSPEVQCLATSDDGMIAWKKYGGNPVIGAPPEGLKVTGFRDPCVWREANTWYMLIGSGFRGVGGTALLYTSPDLLHWKYLHPLFIGKMNEQAKSKNPVATGEMWECPDFFPLGDKHVLIVSTQGTTLWFVGTYAERKFLPESQGQLDFGSYYAPKSMVDGRGRRILWGWVQEGRRDEAQRAAGWSGVLSLPRVLSLGASGGLEIAPAPELEVLRGTHRAYRHLHVTPSSAALLKEIQGECLEIAAEFEPGDAEEFGLKVRAAPDASEQTLVFYNRTEKRLKVDRERSSLSPEVDRGVQEGSFELAPGETLKLRVFLDCSVVEVFANRRACLTERVYPTRADSLGLSVFARGGGATLTAMDVWKFRPISPHRMTT